MEKQRNLKRQSESYRPGRIAGVIVISAATWFAGGCAAVPAHQQILVSRPGMTFSSSLVENPRVNVLSQIEAGVAVSGGAEGAGCTACR